jgi:hypothetical protein
MATTADAIFEFVFMASFLRVGASYQTARSARAILRLTDADDARPKKSRSFRSALADSKMAAISPERKTRHIPFPGQLLLSL